MNISKTLDKYFTLDEILQDIPETATAELGDIEETYQSYIEELNEELKTTDRVWLEFQAGQCAQFGHVAKSLLYRIVKSSVDSLDNSIAAANAITILKVMGISFSCLDLQRIKVPKADLSGAILDRADLSYADLTSANLKNASLNQTKLENTTLKEVDLGTENVLNTFQDFLQTCCFSHKNNNLFIITKNKQAYVCNIVNKTRKEIDLQTLFNDQALYGTTAYFVSDNRVAILYEDFNSKVLYLIDISSTKELKFHKSAIDLDKNSIISTFNDYLITIHQVEEYSSMFSIWRFNTEKDEYEKKTSIQMPYKFINNSSTNECIYFSSAETLIAMRGSDRDVENLCIIFNYESNEIVSEIELEEPFGEAVFSDNLQYLALKLLYNDELVMYSIDRSDKDLLFTFNEEFRINKINVDAFKEIKFINNDKYLAFINDRSNILEIIDLTKNKRYYYQSASSVIDFHSIPNLEKCNLEKPALERIIICESNAVQIISLEELLSTPSYIESNVLDKGKRNFICDIYCLEKESKDNKLQQTLYLIKLDQFLGTVQIESFQSISLGSVDFRQEKSIIIQAEVDESSQADISPGASYVILSSLDFGERIGASIGKKIDLYNLSNGEHYCSFSAIYYDFKLSLDDRYAFCITEDAELQVWDILSKNNLYLYNCKERIENYSIIEIPEVITISKSYIIVLYGHYLRVLSFSQEFKCNNLFDISNIDHFDKKFLSVSYLNENSFIITYQSKIYIYDLSGLCSKSFDLFPEIEEINHFDILPDKGLMVIYSFSNKKNIPGAHTICLLDISAGKLLDSVIYQCNLKKIHFSTYGTSIVGYSDDKVYIWHIKQDKLFLTYRDPAVLEACDLDGISQPILH